MTEVVTNTHQQINYKPRISSIFHFLREYQRRGYLSRKARMELENSVNFLEEAMEERSRAIEGTAEAAYTGKWVEEGLDFLRKLKQEITREKPSSFDAFFYAKSLTRLAEYIFY